MNNQSTTTVRLTKFVAQADAEPSSMDTVGGVVLEAVRTTCEETKQPIIRVRDVPMLEPKSMLRILIYCYLKRILASEAVEEKLWKNPELRTKAFNELPTAHTIRRFRKLNGGMVQAALEKALRGVRCLIQRTSLEDGRSESQPLSTSIKNPSGGTTLLVHREAADRIHNAMIMDTTLSDEA